jgi:hypothetical protein
MDLDQKVMEAMLTKLSIDLNSDDFNPPTALQANFPRPDGEVSTAEADAHTRRHRCRSAAGWRHVPGHADS